MDKYNGKAKSLSKHRHKYSKLQGNKTNGLWSDDEDANQERQTQLSDLNEIRSIQCANESGNSNTSGSDNMKSDKHIVMNGRAYYPYKLRNLPEIRTFRTFRKKCILLVVVSLVILMQIGLALHYIEQNSIGECSFILFLLIQLHQCLQCLNSTNK